MRRRWITITALRRSRSEVKSWLRNTPSRYIAEIERRRNRKMSYMLLDLT
jgi:hypothetical protein